MDKIVNIKGMSCGGCASRVEKALGNLGLRAKVELSKHRAVVEEDKFVTDEAIKTAVENMGFEVTSIV